MFWFGFSRIVKPPDPTQIGGSAEEPSTKRWQQAAGPMIYCTSTNHALGLLADVKYRSRFQYLWNRGSNTATPCPVESSTKALSKGNQLKLIIYKAQQWAHSRECFWSAVFKRTASTFLSINLIVKLGDIVDQRNTLGAYSQPLLIKAAQPYVCLLRSQSHWHYWDLLQGTASVSK